MSPRPLTQIKHFTDGLVVRWVTTSESPLLYVFAFFADLSCSDVPMAFSGPVEMGDPLRESFCRCIVSAFSVIGQHPARHGRRKVG
jgi:hypothetical protein